ncbi:hypothetical protein [Euzebyella saccharophila]|uniref:Uncharacterized protein n=1 Tax=Euzebyella saccharophila TaxID=679664 RepID=A0ABV8JQD4_9FLAO|nr:hypothetical protein [Euzebyella saccharophila]
MDQNSKNNPFKTPENYFGSFEDRLKEKISEGQPNFPVEEGFGVPKGYFNDIHSRVIEKMEVSDPKVVKLPLFKNYYYLGASIAAVLIVALAINLGLNKKQPTFDDLAHSEIEAYFQNNDIGITSYELAEVIPVDQLEVYDIVEDQWGDEQMVDYLNENIEDFESLNLEYDE